VERRDIALVDLVAGRGDHVPVGAERLDALAVGVARVLVGRERVQRVAVVGDLLGAVATGDHAELRGRGRSGGRGLSGDRGPSRGACARAGGARALVALEQVDGGLLRARREDRPVLRVLSGDHHRRGGGATGRAGRFRVGAAAARGGRTAGARRIGSRRVARRRARARGLAAAAAAAGEHGEDRS